MAKSSNQKLKLLYIIKILSEQTDENHCMPTQKLIERLAEYNISAERKSIYNDISQLTHFGYDIIHNKSRSGGGYYLATREFELPELKLLVDAVQSSRFITVKKSRELINKLERFAGTYEAKQLRRQVYVAGRIKTENESIYYNVDYIHKAIQNNFMICFQYLDWTLEKELRPRKNRSTYKVSPWTLTWQDENYYLIAYDKTENMIKHYRVDKMGDIEILEGILREGNQSFNQFEIVEYTNRMFGMFGGKEEIVTLQLPNRMIGIILDRFGKDIDIRKRDEYSFSVRVRVVISEPFLGWLTGLGKDVKILSPQSVIDGYQEYLEQILYNYKNSERHVDKNEI